MQHQQTVQLSLSGINAVISNQVNRIHSIYNELESHINQISSLLTSYHWHEKGIVQALKIDKQSIHINQSGKGYFRVKYAINIHYGCSDVDIELDKEMLINIDTDLQTRNAILTGEYIPEREPDGF